MAQAQTARTATVGTLSAQASNTGIFAKIAAWYESYQTRRALSSLTDRELNDIGLSRSDIQKF